MKRKKQIGSKLFQYFALLLVVLLAAGMLLKKEDGLPFLGIGFYSVLTQSMSPTIEAGSLLVVKRTGEDEIRQGDVLTFRPREGSNVLVTHRIVEIERTGEGCQYITKGDANADNDRLPVGADQILGKVVFWIGGLGTLTTNLRPLVFALLVGLLVFYFLHSFFRRKPHPSKPDNP